MGDTTEFTTQVASGMASFDWLEVIKAAAPVATALIAFMALRNWQRQDKAKREAEFLDALVEAAHAYIADLPAPITVLEVAKIGMVSHSPSWEPLDAAEIAIKGAIAFIERDGERTGKSLLDRLALMRASVIKLRSLVVKGQVYNFKSYGRCRSAVAMLAWHFDRMEGFGAFIGSPSLNWTNPIVRETLTPMMSIDAAEVRTAIEKSHAELIEFTRETYKRIYG